MATCILATTVYLGQSGARGPPDARPGIFLNMSKAGLPARDDGRRNDYARGTSDAGRRRSILLMGIASAALFSGANDAGAADINNTAPFANNGPHLGDVISNSSTIDNNAPGYWTGNIQSNTNLIYNNAGATWDGGIQSNRSEIYNFGTWVNGTITGNGDPANPIPAVVGSNGWIYNATGATWHGDINGNSDFVINDGGNWTGNINGNASYVLNNGGTWTGNVVGNSGSGQFTQVVNGGNGLWIGDVQGNDAYVNNNGGVWQGSVLSNSRTLQNSGTWTGNVAGNSFHVYNLSGTWVGDVLANDGTIFNRTANAVVATWNGKVSGNTGSIQNQAGSRWNGDVAGNGGTIENAAATWIGNVTGNAGSITNGALSIWTGNVTDNAGTITNNASWTGTVANAGTFNNGAGATVSGLLTNTAGTTFNDGTLSGGATVSGGKLTGIGTIANATAINGGTFAPGDGTPGTSMTLTGSLVMQAAATYLVQINATTSSLANVTGTTTLGGASVQANFASGSYVAKQYLILHSTAGVSGVFNPTVVNGNLSSNFKTSLSYDGNGKDVHLNLSLSFIPLSNSFGTNRQNVANAVVGFFDSTGSVPLVFGGLTPSGLTQISGETATGAQQTSFDAMTQFMGVMTDPFIAGRGDDIGSGASGAPAFAEQLDASAYAATDPARKKNERDAYAAIWRKAPPMAAPFSPGWSVWAAGFGGSQTTSGNTGLGSNNTTSRLAASAVGADYRFSPDTIAGFALAGGGSGFDVNGSGSGRSDLFQAGAFIRHTTGPAYLSAALAYGWQDITTNRTLTIAGVDRLRAQFNANAYSGRIESGYRLMTPWAGGIGITPYAAAQSTALDLPAYAETAVSGGNTFALSYGARRVTDTRSELGVRADKSYALTAGILTLRARVAWGHDYDADRSIATTFQALPGASFVVNGAAQAPDSALTTASAEMKWIGGWSIAATFDGEFSNVTRSYAGKSVVRYAW
jgi:uncharacterized protein with beta-barrel porin domain